MNDLNKSDIVNLFKGKPVFEKKNQVIDLIFKAVNEPSLLGLDFSDITNLIKSGNKFQFLSCESSNLQIHQKEIDAVSGTIVFITVGENGTLRQVNALLEKHFSKPNLIPIAWMSNKVPTDNPKIEVLLIYK